MAGRNGKAHAVIRGKKELYFDEPGLTMTETLSDFT